MSRQNHYVSRQTHYVSRQTLFYGGKLIFSHGKLSFSHGKLTLSHGKLTFSHGKPHATHVRIEHGAAHGPGIHHQKVRRMLVQIQNDNPDRGFRNKYEFIGKIRFLVEGAFSQNNWFFVRRDQQYFGIAFSIRIVKDLSGFHVFHAPNVIVLTKCTYKKMICYSLFLVGMSKLSLHVVYITCNWVPVDFKLILEALIQGS